MTNNPVWQAVVRWYQRTFSDPNAVGLFLSLVLIFVFLEFFGREFMVLIVSIVVAYLLSTPVNYLTKKYSLPHLYAVLLVYICFIALVILMLVGVVPLLWKQLANLIIELPQAAEHGQKWISDLLVQYPHAATSLHLQNVITLLQTYTVQVGQTLLKYSLSALPNLLGVILYFVLVPLLVLFFLKDQAVILAWFKQYQPENSNLMGTVWSELNEKIGCYVRARVIEVIIVAIVTSIAFLILGLQYALLIGALVGLSVIVPYVGAIVVTVPIVIIGLMQWGFTIHFIYLMIAYILIISVDAYLLVPLLFADAMELHPVVIILSVIIFGSMWGFWGVFFAIPLATLVHVILKEWPRGVQPTKAKKKKKISALKNNIESNDV